MPVHQHCGRAVYLVEGDAEFRADRIRRPSGRAILRLVKNSRRASVAKNRMQVNICELNCAICRPRKSPFSASRTYASPSASKLSAGAFLPVFASAPASRARRCAASGGVQGAALWNCHDGGSSTKWFQAFHPFPHPSAQGACANDLSPIGIDLGATISLWWRFFVDGASALLANAPDRLLTPSGIGTLAPGNEPAATALAQVSFVCAFWAAVRSMRLCWSISRFVAAVLPAAGADVPASSTKPEGLVALIAVVLRGVNQVERKHRARMKTGFSPLLWYFWRRGCWWR